MASERPDLVVRSRAVEQVIAAVERTGGRAHILHLSAAESLRPLSVAQAAGLPVTAETCPHYLALDAADVPDGATAFRCCPPIRGRADSDGLWQGVGKARSVRPDSRAIVTR